MLANTQDILQALRNGAIVVTPNNRLSTEWLHTFFKHENNTCTAKPQCQPYQVFLQFLFKKIKNLDTNQLHPTLLTNAQQLQLWRKIISKDAYLSKQISIDGILHAVIDAWSHCQASLIDYGHADFAQTPQTRQFQQWQQTFQKQLINLNAITTEQLVTYIISSTKHQALQYDSLLDNRPIIWICFDDFTPAQKLLQQTLNAQGCKQHYYDLPYKPHTAQQLAANDNFDEMLNMIFWLKKKLSAGEKRIGIIVPDLQNQSQRIQRLLLQQIPETEFNISLGKPLSDYQLVSHALHWLCLDRDSISPNTIRRLFHSPYSKGASIEYMDRAALSADNKFLQETNMSAHELWQFCKNKAPLLASLLTNLQPTPERATVWEWVLHFKQRLDNLGFPGDIALNSAHYQCLQSFIALLDNFLQLTLISPVMDKTEAFTALYSLTQTTIFQPKKTACHIQVLGLLEASGCNFDSIWVCGLTDQCLPQKTKFSAFIPITLQRAHQMPHTSAAREQQFAEQIIQRLRYGSNDSVFSYPLLTHDVSNLPSPLISSLPTFVKNNSINTNTPLALETYHDNYSLPWLPEEKIAGGSAILTNQAKCPFRAMATHRFNASSAIDEVDGFNPSQRGQVTHRVMELLWQRLETQRALCALSSQQLETLIDDSIATTISSLCADLTTKTLQYNIEVLRLKRLVTACLTWEKQRAPFSVTALEQTFILPLSGIDFRLRVDRLDTLETGEKWVIDYKTTMPTRKPWLDERPEAPQLLLYALLDPDIQTLLYLELKMGNAACSGFSATPISIKGFSALKKNEQWSDYQQKWQQQLTQLAGEFHNGHCPPTPYRISTCTTCEFQNLCRIENNN